MFLLCHSDDNVMIYIKILIKNHFDNDDNYELFVLILDEESPTTITQITLKSSFKVSAIHINHFLFVQS